MDSDDENMMISANTPRQSESLTFAQIIETVKEVFAQYNPQAVSDPRKAYYAKYLDPAIAAVEKDNIRQENIASRLADVRGRLAALKRNKEQTENPAASTERRLRKHGILC